MNYRNVAAGGGGTHGDLFHDVISLENLFAAWQEFKRGKTSKIEVQNFEFNLEDNIFQLHENLEQGRWKPDPYKIFYIRDPKLRCIHKASVRDRVFNHALFRKLYPIFDPTFIHDSYSCRVGKGTHRGVLRLENFTKKLSKNYTRPAYALKCDIKKFFDNISHEIMEKLIEKKIQDDGVLKILRNVIESFETKPGFGLPLGNVTSQLFANVYLNELDQCVKHKLKAEYYLRYCDDFIVLSRDKNYLEKAVREIDLFINSNLKLSLHPNKITIRKISQGVDFLGYVVLPYYRVLRTGTKKRMFKKLKFIKRELDNKILSKESFDRRRDSYLGTLTHCRGYNIKNKLEKELGI